MIAIPLAQFGLMSIRQVATYYKTTPRCVWRWVAEERLQAVPVDRCMLIPRAECEKFGKPKRWRRRGTNRWGRKKRAVG